jgi:hypothetical protein
MKVVLKRAILSLLLTVGTMAAIGSINRLPYSPLRDYVTDAFSLPGGLIARVFYPAGIHTDHGAPNWGYVAAWSNVVFYIALWYVILLLLRFPRKTSHT